MTAFAPLRPLQRRALSPVVLLLAALLLAPPAGAQQDPVQNPPGEDPQATPPDGVPAPPPAPPPPPSGGAPVQGLPSAESGVDPAAESPVPPQAPAAAGQAPAAAGAPDQTAPVPVDPNQTPANRLDFDLTFPEEQGGGSAVGSAGSLEYRRDDYAVLSGGVTIKYQDIELTAERAELDLETKIVTAQGDVVLDQGPRRLAGATLTFDLDTKTGTMTEASGQVSADYFFRGREVSKTGDDTYEVVDGLFTSCKQEVPDWSFRLGRATVEVGGYAHVKHATMRAKHLPLIYVPYIVWPVKSERSSGLLVPNFGYSDQRGFLLGLAYYQVLGRSYDTTVHLDTYSEGFLGLGNEFRYRPSEGTRGTFVGYAVRDPDAEEEFRWKIDLRHVSDDLPYGVRGGLNYQAFSDFNFFKDFERDFDRNTQRFIYSSAFLTKNTGPHLFNFLADEREVLVGVNQGGENIIQRRLPEFEYRLRQTKLFERLYLQAESSAAFLETSELGSYGRVDLFPRLRYTAITLPWLSLSLDAGERVTWYGDSLDETDRSRLSGESLTRTLPSGGAEVVGPSFARIYDFGFGRVRHVIQPRFNYSYFGDFDDPELVPRFDQTDNSFSTNLGRAVLSNRFLAKPRNKPDAASTEVLLIELARNFSFDDTQPLEASRDGLLTTNGGPLEARVRFNPARRTSVEARAFYSLLFDKLTSTELSGNVGFGQHNFGLTWTTRRPADPFPGQMESNQVRLSGGIEVLPRRLQIEGQINYDFADGGLGLQQQRYVATYLAQCYSLRIEYRDFRAGIGDRVRDKDFRFALTLKNVGTFLDLTGRSSTEGEP